ncbi:hypothetical protein ACEN9J_07740 [Variovorax sp. Varisp41]|uniref:hypothetical protein n=1 Tax=Variovorax sp. Varisp41 TaxID=3243033 RepID=UPI0039B5A3E6
MNILMTEDTQGPPNGTNPRIAAIATRLAHLHAADEATIWAAIPAVFPEVMGEPCDQEDAYHIAIAGAVMAEVRSSNRE